MDEEKVWEYFKDIIVPVVQERQVQRNHCSKSISELLLEFSQIAKNSSEVMVP